MKTFTLLFHFLLFNQQVYRGQACLCSLLIAAGKFTVSAPMLHNPPHTILHYCSAPPLPPAVRVVSTRMTSAAAASSAPGRSSRHVAARRTSPASVQAACSASRHAVSHNQRPEPSVNYYVCRVLQDRGHTSQAVHLPLHLRGG